MKYINLIVWLLVSNMAWSQTNPAAAHCLSADEQELFELVNAHRTNNGLEPIALSKSLSYVARMHAMDLEDNVGELTHGWSDCAYISGDKSTYNCMWLKPSELCQFPGRGFECAYSSSQAARPENAVAGWQKSPAHNAVILNQNIWEKKTWLSLGIAVYGHYACIWFSAEADPLGVAELCPED